MQCCTLIICQFKDIQQICHLTNYFITCRRSLLKGGLTLLLIHKFFTQNKLQYPAVYFFWNCTNKRKIIGCICEHKYFKSFLFCYRTQDLAWLYCTCDCIINTAMQGFKTWHSFREQSLVQSELHWWKQMVFVSKILKRYL